MGKTKKLLVVSDNHGSGYEMEYLLDTFGGKIDGLVHCGDSEWSPEYLEDMFGCPVYCAKGNCDSGFLKREETLFEFGEHTCFVTHGHFYGVNWGCEDLLEKAMEVGADVVFYGHTHIPNYEEYGDQGVILMNPGSVSQPRQVNPQRTFLMIEMEEDGVIRPMFYTL